MCPEDYIPMNIDIIKDKGINIPFKGGVEPLDRDFFGNPIIGKPDLGAIECK